MSAFLYYFPCHGSTKSQLTREDVLRTPAKDALWDVLHTASRFAAHTVAAVAQMGGPDGTVGTVLACTQDNEEILDFKIGYYPKLQTWVRVGEAKAAKEYDVLVASQNAAGSSASSSSPPDPNGREKFIAWKCPYWLGWYNDPQLTPKPEGLRRLWPIAGTMVELCDGNQWEAPIIRSATRRTVTLPQVATLQDDDSVELEVKPEFAEFLNLADRIWDHYWGTDGRMMNDTGVLDAAIKCLNLNYRVGRAEVRALKLLDTDNWKEIFRASNNFRVIEELLNDDEKKESAPTGSDASPGPEGLTTPDAASGNSTLPPV